MDRRGFIKRGLALLGTAVAPGIARSLSAHAAAPLFQDSFARANSSRGWGQAWFNQRYQMTWGISRRRGFYSMPAPYIPPPDDTGHVGEGAARYSPNPVLVLDRDVADVNLVVNFSVDNPNARFGLVARSIGYGDYYGAYIDRDSLIVSRFTLNKELEIKRVPFKAERGTAYRMRLKVAGTGSVSLKAKVWKASRKEPARFDLVTTDPEKNRRIDKDGAFGMLFMHDYRTRRKTRVKVWRFSAASAQTPARTRPRITFAFLGRLSRAGDTYQATVVAKSEFPATIKFKVGTHPKLNDAAIVTPVEYNRKVGVAKATLPALPAGETIYWQVVTTSKTKARAKSGIHSFATPPVGNNDASFAFGSCTNFYPPLRSLKVAAAMGPLFFVHLGDLGYPEHVDAAALAMRKDCFQDRWIRMIGRNAAGELHKTASWIMTQDDHDYGRDNVWRDTVRDFTVPAFDELSGNRNERYFDMRYGDLHAFVVDCHIHSDNPEVADGPNHSILGATQKTWLKDKMRASDAQLLVVFTSLPFWGAGQGRTTWKSGFRDEGNELKDFFRSLQGPNRRVLICSGNAHAQFVARHAAPAGDKDLYEFVSSQSDHVDNEIAGPLKITDGVIDPERAVKNTGAFGFVELQGGSTARTVRLRSIDSVTGRDTWPPLILNL